MLNRVRQQLPITRPPLAKLGTQRVHSRAMKTARPMRRLLAPVFVYLFLFGSLAGAAVTEGVGLYIGSFDPPTLGHREIVLRSALKTNLRNVYVSVNRGGKNSTKDYRWGLGERLSMVRSMFRDTSIRVVVLAEPLEGRVALAKQIAEHYNKPLRGIFGADTLVKNHTIFKILPEFEYIAVSRPGYKLPDLSAGTVVYSLESAGDISSTEVRKKLADGVRNIAELHIDVETFIYENNPLRAAKNSTDRWLCLENQLTIPFWIGSLHSNSCGTELRSKPEFCRRGHLLRRPRLLTG